MAARKSPKMVMSQTPAGVIRITLFDATRLLRDGTTTADIFRTGRASSDAIATEIVPMTDAAYASFAARHPGRLLYSTLSAYPRPRA